MSLLVSRFTAGFEAHHGYPPGANVLVRADSAGGRRAAESLSAAGACDDLRDFYAQIERVSLPDVGNGFFVQPAEEVVRGMRGGQPTTATGALVGAMTVSLLGSTYDVGPGGLADIATDLWGFLGYLREELSRALPPS